MKSVVVGLTGGIASGKSTVSQFLQELGACVIDADDVAHSLSEPGQSLYKAYVEHFGSDVLTPEGKLDRGAIAQRVFSRPEEKQRLDELAHPLILKEFKRRLQSAKDANEPLIVLDVPLLFEAGWDKMADETWLVYVTEKEQMQRLCKRNSFSEEEAWARIRSQMPLSEKVVKADVCIDNDGSVEQTRSAVYELWKERVHE